MSTLSLFSMSMRMRAMLLTMLVATAGAAMMMPALAQPTGGAPGASHPMHGGPSGPFGGRMLERALTTVNATPDQRTRIHDIMKAAAADVRQQREASRGLRQQALTLFAQPTVDARAVEALRQQMLQQHDQSSRRWMQAMLDASAVLTPEQRQQLAQRIQQHREARERRHQREPGASQPAR